MLRFVLGLFESTETWAGKKPCGLKRLGENLWGQNFSRGRGDTAKNSMFWKIFWDTEYFRLSYAPKS